MAAIALHEKDRQLVHDATAAIQTRFVAGWHEVGAALSTTSGRVVRAVHLEADVGRIAVCAEAIAVGMAIYDGDIDFDTIVAVLYPDRVVSPCGMCREMLCYYDPSTKVIMPGPGGELGKIQANELLPGKDGPR